MPNELNQKNNLVSLAKASEITGYHQDYLGFLARTGKLRAEKIGRNWVTSEEAIQELLGSGGSTTNPELKSVIPQQSQNTGEILNFGETPSHVPLPSREAAKLASLKHQVISSIAASAAEAAAAATAASVASSVVNESLKNAAQSNLEQVKQQAQRIEQQKHVEQLQQTHVAAKNELEQNVDKKLSSFTQDFRSRLDKMLEVAFGAKLGQRVDQQLNQKLDDRLDQKINASIGASVGPAVDHAVDQAVEKKFQQNSTQHAAAISAAAAALVAEQLAQHTSRAAAYDLPHAPSVEIAPQPNRPQSQFAGTFAGLGTSLGAGLGAGLEVSRQNIEKIYSSFRNRVALPKYFTAGLIAAGVILATGIGYTAYRSQHQFNMLHYDELALNGKLAASSLQLTVPNGSIGSPIPAAAGNSSAQSGTKVVYIQGKPGPQGPQGSAGPQGPQGLQGAQGSQGAAGYVVGSPIGQSGGQNSSTGNIAGVTQLSAADLTVSDTTDLNTLNIGGQVTSNGTFTQNGDFLSNGNITQGGSGSFSTGSGAVSLNGNTTITGNNSLTVGGPAVFEGTVIINGALASGTGPLAILSTTGPQLMTGYDVHNNWTSSTSSTGATTFAFNGANSSAVFTPQHDSTTAFEFTNAASTPIVTVDTQNGALGVSGSLGVTGNSTLASAAGSTFTAGNSTGPVQITGSTIGIGANSGDLSLQTTTSGNINLNPVGVIAANADIQLAANKNIVAQAGTGNFDFSNSTGTFQTGTGAVSLNGPTTANTFASSGAAITGGAINNTPIGQSVPAAGGFTNLAANGNFSQTGSGTFSTGTGNLTLNNANIALAATNPVLDTSSASTLFINTLNNRPVTFGTGAVTMPNAAITNSETITSPATTQTIASITGNSLTSGTGLAEGVIANAGNGQTTFGQRINITDDTTNGGGYIGLQIFANGSGTGTGNKYLLDLNPNNSQNELVFDNTGALRPTVNNSTVNLGSPSFLFSNGYFNTISANNISGTVVTGSTSSTTWTIGSTQTGDTNEEVVFNRNGANAALQWDAGSGDLRYLSVNYPFNNTYTVSPSSIGQTVNLYSGTLTNNATTGTQRLLSLTNTGTGSTQDGIYVNNTGTGVNAIELNGTWSTGLLTNNNSINAGTGAITGGALSGSSLALTSALTVPNGGTGDTTLTTDGVLFGNGTSALQATLAPTAGQLLIGNTSGVPAFATLSGDATISSSGVITLKNTGTSGTYGSASSVPVFTTDAQGRVTGVTNTPIAINANQITSGQLAIANGGTNGSATPTAGAVAYGTGTAYAFSAAGSANQLLTSGGAGTPTFQNISSLLTAGSNINITGTTNAIIAVTSTPSFTTLGVSGLTTLGGNISLTASAPVIDSTSGTLSINTITNEPVTFGSGLVTANNFASSSAAITGGSVNGTPIGATTPSTGAFTTLSSTGTATLGAGSFLSTTAPQLTVGYNSGNEWTASTNSSGSTVFAPSTNTANAFNFTKADGSTSILNLNSVSGLVTANNFGSSSAAITGGSVNGTPIGATTASTGAFTTLSATGTSTLAAINASGAYTQSGAGANTFTGATTANNLSSSGATITGGSINGTPIGGTTLSTGAFTTLSATGTATLANLNQSGNANLATTAGSNTAIGNSTGTFALTSTGLNVSTSGALSGVSGINTSGGYTQTGAGVNTLTGSTTANTFASSGATITGGSINATPIGATTPSTGAFTTLSATGATTLGTASFLSTTTPQLTVGYNSSNEWMASTNSTGSTTFSPSANTTTAFNFTNSGGGTSDLNIDTTNNRVGIGNSSPAALLSVGSSSQLQVTSAGNLSTSGTLTLSALASGTIPVVGTSGLIGAASPGGLAYLTQGSGGTSSSYVQVNAGTGGTPTYFGSVVQNQTALTLNSYYNGSNWVYAQNGYAEGFRLSQNQFQLVLAPSGTAGATISQYDSTYTALRGIINSGGGYTQFIFNGASSTPTLGTNTILAVNANNTADNLATVQLNANAATNKGLVVQGFTSQSADLQEWQNSSGTTLAAVTSAGNLTLAASAPILNASAGTLSINTTTNEPVTFGTGLVTANNFASSSAAITGGSINSTPIGATTASTGAFTSLTDSGLTSGSVPFASTGGLLSQDAGDFNYQFNENGSTANTKSDYLVTNENGGTPAYFGDVVNLQNLVSLNTYFNGSNWIYGSTNAAAAMRMTGSSSFGDSIAFYTVPSGTGGSTNSNMDTAGPKFTISPSGGLALGNSYVTPILATTNGSDPGAGNFIMTGNLGIGTSTPTGAQFTIVGTAPTSVATNGTNATAAISVTGAAGGASSGTTGQTGGTGAAISETGGAGGAVAGASGIGGAGGTLTYKSGAGGAGAATNGNGGLITIQGGAAGAGAGTAGSYGNISLQSSGGNVGIGVTSPTALLNIKAGTATANTEPLQLTAGVLNTTAVSGALETDASNNLYYTPGTATRGIIPLGTAANTLLFTTTAATNVTLPTSGTLATNNGSNWTISGQAIGDIPVASSTTAYGKLADVATGSVLVSGGVGVAPSWSTTPTFTTSTTTPIIYGGTGASSTLTLDGTSNGSPSNAYVLLNPSAQGNVGIGTTTPAGELSVASTNLGAEFGLTTWSNSYSVFGPNAGSTTGAALGLGYSTTAGASNIDSVQPGTAWKPLDFGALQFSFMSNGNTQGLFQNSSGNVGIGTRSPAAVLNVVGTVPFSVAGNGTAATAALTVTGSAGGASSGTTGQTGGTGAGISETAGAGGAVAGVSGIGGAAGTITLTSGAGGAGAATNGNGGLISIQGGAPGAGAGTAGSYGNISLQASGGLVGIAAAAVTGTTLNIATKTATGTNAYGLQVAAPSGATNNYAATFSGGNVGIGTTTPQARIQELSADNLSTNDLLFSFDASGTDYENGISNLFNVGGNGNVMSFNISNGGGSGGQATPLSLTGAGNVGIGTTSPGTPLQIVNATGGDIFRTSGSGLNNAYSQIDNTGGTTQLGVESSAGGSVMVNSLAYASLLQSVSATPLQLGTSQTARLTILSGGNVGIGTASPSALLSVGSSSQFQVNSSGAIAAATGITSSGTITLSGLNTNQGLVLANGSGVLSQTAEGSANQILTGQGTSTPTFQNIASLLTAGTDINITGTTNATIAVSSTPTFSTSTTTPIIYGGTAAGSTLTLDGTSNGSPSNAYVLLNPSAQGNVGIGTSSPTAVLNVVGAAGTNGTTGTAATAALTVAGGAGGNSTGATTAGAAGGAIALTAGAGGNSTGVAGTNGANITLQGGAGGTGSTTGSYGNVILQSSGGDVGIGTASPTEPLTVTGTFQDAANSGVITLNATLPNGVTNPATGVYLNVSTASGTSGSFRFGQAINLTPGYTGSHGSIGLNVGNSVAATGTDWIGFSNNFPNIAGYFDTSTTSTTGTNIGFVARANGSSGINIGSLSSIDPGNLSSSSTLIGSTAFVRPTKPTVANTIGGLYFMNAGNGNTPILTQSAALITDLNGDTSSSGLIVRNNSTTPYFIVANNGNVGVGILAPTAAVAVQPFATSGTPSVTAGSELQLLGTNAFTDNATAASGTATGYSLSTIAQGTLAATNTGVTTTNADTLNILGAPVGGTNETLTAATALNIAAGALTHTTNGYGLQVAAPTGATNNYAATFSGGNVGIGTTSPNKLLEVHMPTDVTYEGLRASAGGGSTDNAGLGIDDVGTFYSAALFASGTEVFKASSNGGIAVGTGYLSSNAPTNGAIIQGNVGIGTAAPSSLFSVGASNQFQVTSGGNLTLTASAPILDSTSGTLSIDTTTNEPVTFGTGLVTSNNFASSSAAITGGSVNNTPVGATTPSTGAFTTLSATGAVSVPGSYSGASIVGSALTLDSTNHGYNAVTQGSLEYMTAQGGSNSDLIIVDLSTPTVPKIVSKTVEAVGSMNGIAVQGKYVYVTYYGNSTLQIFDVSNPYLPVSVGTVTTCTNPYGGLAVEGDYAYVPCPNYGGTGSFSVVNISNPTAPAVVTTITMPSTMNDSSLAVWGQMLYANGGNESSTSMMYAYSIANPASPSLYGSGVAVDHSPQKITAQGTTVVASLMDSNELSLVDFSNPSSPVVHSVTLTASCSPQLQNGIVLQANLAFVACSTGGVDVVNISTITSPTLLGLMASSITNPTFIVPDGRYIYISNSSGSMYTVDMGGEYVQQVSSGTLRTDAASVRGALDAGSISVQGGISTGQAISTAADLNVLGGGYFGGNVGIGTTTPSYPLTVVGTATSPINGLVYASTSGTTGGDVYNAISDNGNALYAGTNTGSGYGVYITAPQNYFSGEVGIGTSSPATALQVVGVIAASNESTGLTYTGQFGQQTTTNSKQVLIGYNPGSNYGIIQTIQENIGYTGQSLAINPNGGNVGIGTTAPAVKLQAVSGTEGNPATSGTTQTNGIMRLAGNDNGVLDTGEYATAGAFWIQATDKTTLAQTYNISLDPNGGDIGIGTGSPTLPLSVYAGSTSSPATSGATPNGLQSWTANGGATLYTGEYGSGNGYAAWFQNSNSGNLSNTYPITLNPDGGSVGIGTANPTDLPSLSGALEVYGGQAIDSNNANSDLYFYNSGTFLGAVGKGNYAVTGANASGLSIDSANSISFSANNSTAQMILTTGGDLGIGTVSPGQVLQVGDNTHAGNAVVKNGYLCVGNGASSGNGSCAGAATAGTIYANATSVAQGDYAEAYLSTNMNMQPGMLVTSDSQVAGNMVATTGIGYDPELTGVISTAPGVLIGNGDTANPPANQKAYPIALNGRVPVLVTDENGPVQPGDYLTSSASMPGYAMKALHSGMIIGQSLGSFSSTTSGALTQTINGVTIHTGTITLFVHPEFAQVNNTYVLGADDATLAQTLAQGTNNTQSLTASNTSNTFIIRQNAPVSGSSSSQPVGGILQLQSGSATRFMVASDGAVDINTQPTTANENLFVINNNGSAAFIIAANGNVTIAATLVVKQDIAALGEVLGTTAIMARNDDGSTLHQGDVVIVTGAEAASVVGSNPILSIARASASSATQAQAETVVGIVDRNLSAFDIPGAPSSVTTDTTQVPNGEYLDVVTGGTFAAIHADASGSAIAVGDKLTISANPGYARKMLSGEIGQVPVIGVALDSLASGTGTIRVYLMLNSAVSVTAQVPATPAVPAVAPASDSSSPTSSDSGSSDSSSSGSSVTTPDDSSSASSADSSTGDSSSSGITAAPTAPSQPSIGVSSDPSGGSSGSSDASSGS